MRRFTTIAGPPGKLYVTHSRDSFDRLSNIMKSSLPRTLAKLQAYALLRQRERDMEAGLESFGDLLRREARRLSFDDQPSDFRAVQMKSVADE
ncbi:MAG: hypothetical protein AB7K64_17695 [Variibacter sp.]